MKLSSVYGTLRNRSFSLCCSRRSGHYHLDASRFAIRHPLGVETVFCCVSLSLQLLTRSYGRSILELDQNFHFLTFPLSRNGNQCDLSLLFSNRRVHHHNRSYWSGQMNLWFYLLDCQRSKLVNSWESLFFQSLWALIGTGLLPIYPTWGTSLQRRLMSSAVGDLKEVECYWKRVSQF